MTVERDAPVVLPASGLDVSVPTGAASVELTGHAASLDVELLDEHGTALDDFIMPYFANGGRALRAGTAYVRIRPPAQSDGDVAVRVEFLIGHRAAGCKTRLARPRA